MSASSEPSARRRVRLPPTVALHARPARRLVVEAARFRSRISVAANGKEANAKSILEVLALGATAGTELALSASGEDAITAVGQLAAVVSTLS